jgi:hypothetical protein
LWWLRVSKLSFCTDELDNSKTARRVTLETNVKQYRRGFWLGHGPGLQLLLVFIMKIAKNVIKNYFFLQFIICFTLCYIFIRNISKFQEKGFNNNYLITNCRKNSFWWRFWHFSGRTLIKVVTRVAFIIRVGPPYSHKAI